jgi:hypothetical protein
MMVVTMMVVGVMGVTIMMMIVMMMIAVPISCGWTRAARYDCADYA